MKLSAAQTNSFLQKPDAATRAFLERREHMPPAEAVWATVPYAYALSTRRAAADRIGADIAEALRLPLELDEHPAPSIPPQIHAPTLVLHGAQDLLVPPANARALAAAMPHADQLELEGAAHHYATDVPEADRRILRFLTTRSGAARRRPQVGHTLPEPAAPRKGHRTLLNAETRHLIGEASFRRTKPTAILINTSRGPVVDEHALYRALVDQRLAGAALDVWEQEPVAACEGREQPP